MSDLVGIPMQIVGFVKAHIVSPLYHFVKKVWQPGNGREILSPISDNLIHVLRLSMIVRVIIGFSGESSSLLA